MPPQKDRGSGDDNALRTSSSNEKCHVTKHRVELVQEALFSGLCGDFSDRYLGVKNSKQ